MIKKESKPMGASKNPAHKNTSSKRLIIATVVAIVAVVGVVVLILFLQSPDKLLARGMANLVTAGSVGIDASSVTKSTDSSQTFRLTGVTDKKVAKGQVEIASSGGLLNLNGKADVLVTEDAAIFIKVDNPKQAIDSYMSGIKKLMASLPGGADEGQAQEATVELDAQMSTLEEKLASWIKINKADLGSGGEQGVQCYVDSMRSLGEDADARTQLADAYRHNSFFVVAEKLGSEGASQGYKVTISQPKLRAFKSAIASNATVKKLGECGMNLMTLGSTDPFSDHSIDIWVNRLSGKITRIQQGSLDIKFSYGQRVNVDVPKEFILLKDILPGMPTTASGQ